MTEFWSEPQELDETDGPPPDVDPDDDGAIKAWSVHSSSHPHFHGSQSVQLKTVGRTHKSVSMSFWGSNPESPSRTRLEIEQYRKVLGGFDFDGKPEINFYLENEEIQALKAFLAGQFLPADGYYVRVDSKEMAQQVATMSAENLGEVLAAISDKTHLIEAIQASGHADFLADYVTNERKRIEIGHLETAVWDKDSNEAVFQKILERNPWMFGGQYVAARRERTFVDNDQYDVPLVTADGSLHLVELKKAHITPLIREHRRHLMVSGEVHAAVSQTQNYLRSLDETRDRVQTEFGINARRVHATVVIGHVDHAEDRMPHDKVYETIRTYNSYMSRIAVMTYDQLVTNARNALEMLGHVPELDDNQDEDDEPFEPDYEPEYENDDDPWASYDGPGPDELDDEPPF